MDLPITYISNFIADPAKLMDALWSELAWVRMGLTPRREYYTHKQGVSYTYGSGAGVRTYESQPEHAALTDLRHKLEDQTGTPFPVLFLNGYENARDSLGWHADDSDTMDAGSPIAIVSVGAEREIWFTRQDEVQDPSKRTAVKLQHGSLCLMHAGMQQTHFHRIPKASFVCGPRVSITARNQAK